LLGPYKTKTYFALLVVGYTLQRLLKMEKFSLGDAMMMGPWVVEVKRTYPQK
jgi:hypothetical protein